MGLNVFFLRKQELCNEDTRHISWYDAREAARQNRGATFACGRLISYCGPIRTNGLPSDHQQPTEWETESVHRITLPPTIPSAPSNFQPKIRWRPGAAPNFKLSDDLSPPHRPSLGRLPLSHGRRITAAKKIQLPQCYARDPLFRISEDGHRHREETTGSEHHQAPLRYGGDKTREQAWVQKVDDREYQARKRKTAFWISCTETKTGLFWISQTSLLHLGSFHL